MSFLKAPPQQPKNETVQLRLSQIVSSAWPATQSSFTQALLHRYGDARTPIPQRHRVPSVSRGLQTSGDRRQTRRRWTAIVGSHLHEALVTPELPHASSPETSQSEPILAIRNTAHPGGPNDSSNTHSISKSRKRFSQRRDCFERPTGQASGCRYVAGVHFVVAEGCGICNGHYAQIDWERRKARGQ